VTPVELDYLRSKLLTVSRGLGAVLFVRRFEYDFSLRPRCPTDAPCTSKAPCAQHRLERLQWQLDELRALFVTTKSLARLRQLALALPRLSDALSRASTGWRDGRGVVHRYSVYDPSKCTRRCHPHCERCELRAGNAAPVDGEFAETCEHGRRWDQPCRRCKADDAATDAL